MKQLLTLIILFSSFIQAQFYQIDYDFKSEMAFTDEGLKQFSQAVSDVNQRKMILEGMKNIPVMNYVFTYNDKESKTKFELKLNNMQTEQGPFLGVPPLKIGQNSVVKYNKGIYLDEADVMGKQFLVYDSIQRLNFKQTGNSKEILGRKVKEVKAKYKDIEILAWYDELIPYQFSPDGFYGTNGLILELHYKYLKDGVEVISSWIPTKITALKNTPVYKLNEKLKKITFPEMEKMYEEYNNQQREQMNSGIDRK